MKNTVSSPTAQRLKAAGFPQPEPEAGQVWYEGQKAYVLGKIEQWLEIHEKKAFTPNARIKFVREQVVECYDAEGNQTVLHIDSSMGKEYEAIVTDETVTIESVFGLITLPRKEAFILEWL